MAEFGKKTNDAYRRKAIRQEELRERLRAMAYLRLLERAAAKAPQLESAEEIAGLRLQADIYMKLLNKALPDLKAIEHTGRKSRNVDELSRDQLKSELAEIRAAFREGTEVPGSREEPRGIHLDS